MLGLDGSYDFIDKRTVDVLLPDPDLTVAGEVQTSMMYQQSTERHSCQQIMMIVSKYNNFCDSELDCCETWQCAFNFLICPPLADMHPSKAPLLKATPGVQFCTSQLLLANNKAKEFKYHNKFIKNPKVRDRKSTRLNSSHRP